VDIRKLGDFPICSLESRALARAMLERAERKPGTVLRLVIVHIGHDGTEPLPAPQRIKWVGGVTAIVHEAGAES
jgi:hypothetical protein